MSMKTMNWGIIGCGDVTEVKSGPAFRKVPGSTLVSVMRRNAERAEDYARRHGVGHWTTDAEDILSSDDIDAVYIATHPNTHAEYTLRAAQAGKAVYVEKPMAVSPDECRGMIAACAEAGVPLWTAYYRRALPRFERVRQLIADGAIGEVRAVNSIRFQGYREGSWQNRPELSGGGWFFDSACHTLDWLDHMFGPLEDVQGSATSRAAGANEDTVVASYRFPGGVLGSGTWCYDSRAEDDRTTIVGVEGSLTVSISAPKPIEWRRGSDVEFIDVGDPDTAHQPLVQTIVDEWNGSGHCPSTGESALRTATVLDTLLSDVRPADSRR
jgi:predicted dehydrogenase